MNDAGDSDGDDGAQAEVDKSEAEAQDDEFDAEDTPEDSFLELKSKTKVKAGKRLDRDVEDQSIDEDDDFEYGDAASYDRLADPSDYSEHQFIAGDDARGVKAMNDAGDADGDDGAQAEVDKSEAEAQDDEFDAEDTPEDSFLALKSQTKRMKAGKRLDQDVEDQSIDEDDDFEYGDAASHDRLADPSDYSEHQFIAGDDARGVKAMNDA